MTQELAALEDPGLDSGEGDARTWSLDGLNLLYVGGRPHQIARIREAVEQASGHLIHHDGGIEERQELLIGLVSRADVAVFPVDCVSHSAALLLKRMCRHLGKPYLPLRTSGLASLVSALKVNEQQNLAAAE